MLKYQMEEDSLESEAESRTTERRKLRAKYVRSIKECRCLKQKLESACKEIDTLKRILVRELGSEEAFEDALCSRESGWQGRAAEIVDLRKRVRELSGQVTNMTVVVDHRKEHELQTRIDNLEGEVQNLSMIRKSLKSRTANLESAYAIAKKDIETLLQKDRVNVEIISCLKAKLNDHEY